MFEVGSKPAPVIVSVCEIAPWPTWLGLTAVTLTWGGSGSSLVIVPTPSLPAIPPFTGLDRWSAKVSSGSNVVSPLMVTSTLLLVSPGAKTKVPAATT